MQPPVFLSPGRSRDWNEPMGVSLVMGREEEKQALGKRCEAAIAARKTGSLLDDRLLPPARATLWLWVLREKTFLIRHEILARGRQSGKETIGQSVSLEAKENGWTGMYVQSGLAYPPRKEGPLGGLFCFTAPLGISPFSEMMKINI